MEVSRNLIMGNEYKPDDTPSMIGMKSGDSVYIRSEALDGMRPCTLSDMGVADDDVLILIPLAVKVHVKIEYEDVCEVPCRESVMC